MILVGRDGRRRVVLGADAAAQAAGLRVGMPATKAQALLQGLVIQDADPAGDAEALDRLALWMLRRFAPIIAADAPNGIVIDSTGADHLYGDGFVSEPGKAAGDVAPLPIAALRLAPDMVGGLRELGFEHIGDLLAHGRRSPDELTSQGRA